MEKNNIFEKLKKLFLENRNVRNLVYYNTLIVAAITLPKLLYWLVFICLFAFESIKKFPTEEVNGREVRIRGVVDKKIDVLADKLCNKIVKSYKKIKNLVKPKREINVIDLQSELKRIKEENITKEAPTNNIEQINKRLQEININGSIIRDSKEIAKEKEEYLSLLKILQQYQGTENKEETFCDTPVPTIEINDDHNKGHMYIKK